MDDVFKALADPSRRALLDRLNARNGQTLRELCAGLDMARQSVSKHLAVLEAANLVNTVWRGREKLHYVNAEPINAIADRWITQYDKARVHALADLKTALEAPMSRPEFVYTTYINATPERVWQALTEPEFTKQYWGVEFESDWTKGAQMTWTESGYRIVDPEQVVLESDPYTRLSYSWHTYTPDWAGVVGIPEEERDALLAEDRSTVTFTLDQQGPVVKLIVVHEGGERTLSGVSEGWPAIMSSLKSLLETGAVLPTA
jgi:uncharacterized protein YndB with AHSA1/START domain/DNA-binding transcriptional ArsR family regulator